MLARNNKSNQQSRTTQHAFTIVELLIVIVIIGILAAIAIVAYNGITNRAHQASLQSDLSNGAKVLGADNVTTGNYPASAAAANGGKGLQASAGNTFTYNPSSDGTNYCLQITGYGSSYFATNTNTIPQGGICNGSVGLAGDPSNPPHIPMVTTLAGNGTAGFVDGTGTAAEFGYPCGVALDASGNAYMPDCWNANIRKVTPSGVVTTLAGSGTDGYANGNGTAAQFSYPNGVTVDSAGNVFVADTNNNRVRKITPSGTVSTFAGSGTAGWLDGSGTTAQFDHPNGVAVDASGNVYVADWNNNRIRKITPAGAVTTVAGSGMYGYADGTGTAAQFRQPRGIAVDISGVIYVADTNNNLIRKISTTGSVTTLAGSTYGDVDGSGTVAQFSRPTELAVDAAGYIYVTDSDSNRIRKITPTGFVATLAGSTDGYADGVGMSAQFSEPLGIAVDATGAVYVADGGNHRIRVIK